MVILEPLNLKKWIDDHRHLLKPPVGNQVIYKLNKDFIVMVVGGPNARKDFHFNKGEEIFYQLEGNITLKIFENNQVRNIFIQEGDLFLLPPEVPHCPVRGANTIGLVIERYRDDDELDGFFWYCENCNHKLYESFISVKDIVTQLPLEMEKFYASKKHCTCQKCGTFMVDPRK